MVSNSTLGAIAVASGLSGHIFYAPRETVLSIDMFSKTLTARQSDENEKAAEEKRATGQYWRGTEPPKVCRSLTIVPCGSRGSKKILVHFVKSIIGVLYMPDCSSLASVELFFNNVLRPFYDKYITLSTLALRPTTTLVELLRAQGCQSFDIKKEPFGPTTRCQGLFYSHTNQSMVLISNSVLLHDQVLASAEDQRPSYAVIRACHSALDSLGKSSFLSLYCDCRAHPKKKAKGGSFDHLLATEDG